MEAGGHLLTDSGCGSGATDAAQWRTSLHQAEVLAAAGSQVSGEAGVMLYMTPLGSGLRKGEMGGWCGSGSFGCL